jgi:hypothetical protein
MDFKSKLCMILEKITIREDQYKMPSAAHRLRQTSYRSSFGKSPSFGGVTNGKAK